MMAVWLQRLPCKDRQIADTHKTQRKAVCLADAYLPEVADLVALDAQHLGVHDLLIAHRDLRSQNLQSSSVRSLR